MNSTHTDSYPNGGGENGNYWDQKLQKYVESGGEEPVAKSGLDALWVFGHGNAQRPTFGLSTPGSPRCQV